MSPVYPPEFDDWPRSKKMDWMTYTYNRRSLIETLLIESGCWTSDREFDTHDAQLTKSELAAILISLDRGPL